MAIVRTRLALYAAVDICHEISQNLVIIGTVEAKGGLQEVKTYSDSNVNDGGHADKTIRGIIITPLSGRA